MKPRVIALVLLTFNDSVLVLFLLCKKSSHSYSSVTIWPIVYMFWLNNDDGDIGWDKAR